MLANNAGVEPPRGSGDQPPLARASRRAWWNAVFYIATIAMFLRFFALPLKPLHHDEGVNALLLTSLVRPPHVYKYDPANYHGPTLYYLAWPSTAAFGMTTFGIRFVTAVAGLVAVLLIFTLSRRIGTTGALVAASLLALSPGAVYFSRYFIHETLLVCFTLGTVVAAAMWRSRAKSLFLYVAAVAAGLMFATKETAIISFVVLVAAATGASVLFELRSAVLRGGVVSVWRDLRSAGFAWWRVVTTRHNLMLFASAIGLFVAVNLLFYTSLFTRWQGAVDAFNTFAFWKKTGPMQHVRPWQTYLNWLSQEELPLTLLGLSGAGLALWRADNRFSIFAALWAVGIITAYSVIPYKTPWLALNMIAPLAITGGYWSEFVWKSCRSSSRLIALVAAAAVVGVVSYQTVVLNFVRYDDGRYPYVYAHTNREVLTLVDEIRRLQAHNPAITIAITSEDQFPLSWYLRDYRAGYYGRPLVTNDSLIIGSEEQRETLERMLGDQYERLGSYRLRPGVRLVLYARRDLRKVTTRTTDFDLLWTHRRTAEPSRSSRASIENRDSFTRRLS
jgi:uncharacterized protein (TIGR03663 family)